jgi:hypothetical protein
MTTVFLSYSTKDHYFADLAALKLAEEGINLWRDRGQLRAGGDWRSGIERGVAESIAVLVALSEDSAESSYVTFEWAYGLGKGKTIIPVKLENCKIHPRLEIVQYLDFSIPGSLPWSDLIERIREVESDATSQEDLSIVKGDSQSAQLDPTVKSILAYLNRRGYQMVSYDRLQRRIDPELTYEKLDALVEANPLIFRRATLKEGKRGLAKQIP